MGPNVFCVNKLILFFRIRNKAIKKKYIILIEFPAFVSVFEQNEIKR